MAERWRNLTAARRARWPALRGAVARPRLRERLDASQVLVVVAPAGYGKTTALASGVPELGGVQAWLTLDVDDTEPRVLTSGLALATEHLKGAEAALELMDTGASPRRVAARVADVLDANGAYLVIDEAQHLLGSQAEDILRELLDCGSGRVALLSRVPLPLLELTRLEAAGEVSRLTAADLSFTPEEVEALLRAHGTQPSAAQVRLAHAVTEGWPIAVRFLAQAAGQGRVRLDSLADLDGGEAQLSTLFAYLAQEVLGPLEPNLRDILTRGSLFEELTPPLLTEVLGIPDGGSLLEALAGSGTFLTRVAEGVYRAHPLLRAQLREGLPSEQARELAALGATYFERTGRFRRALSAHLLAGDSAQAAELLVQRGQDWLAHGRLRVVSDALRRLPPTAWTPELHALAGDALRLSSRYAEALAEYALATPYRRALGEIQVALDTVQPDLAWSPLETAEALSAGPPQRAAVRRLRAENLLNAGRLSLAVQDEPELAGSARYALRSGDLNGALHLARQAAAGELGGSRAAQNHREGLLLASFLHAMQGQAEEAAQAALEGLREGERLESPFVRALALARLGHARQVAGDAAGARAAYQEALSLAHGVSERLQVEPLMGLAAIAGQAGQFLETDRLREEALRRTRGDGYMVALVHLSAAQGKLRGGQWDAASLAQARVAFQYSADRFGLACVALTEFTAGQPASSEVVQAVLDYPFLLARRALFAPAPDPSRRAQVLAQVAALAPQAWGPLTAVAQQLGYDALPTPAQTPGFSVQVQVLGRLAVTRSHETRAREWGRAKARDLLALLAVHPAGVAREYAQEALFPGADPGVGERNFRVTLHALGQVLEEGAESGVFLERGDWLHLNPGPDLRVDLWQAQRWLEQPVGQPGRLAAVLNLPATLADSDLPDVQAAAEQYATRLPEALSQEGELALNTGQTELAAQAAVRALELDPAHEPATRTLLRVHHLRGNGPAGKRVYALLEGALRELSLAPTAETRALYQALFGLA